MSSAAAVAAAKTWLRQHAHELSQFERPATERSVTAMGMTHSMTDDGFSEVDPFDQLECNIEGANTASPWLCIPDTELPPVESFDFL